MDIVDRILGKEIAHYVKAHRGLVIIALVLTAVSALFVVVPAYLLQPFVDHFGPQIQVFGDVGEPGEGGRHAA